MIGYGSWTLFGLLNFNAIIVVPNLVGVSFSIIQIILFRVYKNKTPLTEELNNISNTVMGAVKNVVDKTVEIANSIGSNPPSNQTRESNNNFEQNYNTNTSEPNVNANSTTSNNFNSVTVNQSGDNNDIKQNII